MFSKCAISKPLNVHQFHSFSFFGIWTLLRVSLFTGHVKLKAQSNRTSPGEAGLDPKELDEEHGNLVFETQAKMITTLPFV